MGTRLFLTILALLATCGSYGRDAASEKSRASDNGKIIVAYVTSWSKVMPEVQYMTHINYAFGHVTDTFDGVRVDNEKRLRDITALKKQNPKLKVMLSVGGWGSGRFSEMAADDALRRSFAASCCRVVEEFGLDGIDIDWEYPTVSSAGISASPEDTANFTLLMRDLRKALGKRKLVTLATACDAQHIDFKAILPYIDFVNIMAYDMGGSGKHHAALYGSKFSGYMTASSAVEAHLAAGVPAEKLVMGMPFYGRSGGRFIDYREIDGVAQSEKLTQSWDDKACVPYLADAKGNFVVGFDNAKSLTIKCKYIREKALRGGMYWDYSGDTTAGDLRRAVYEGLKLDQVEF